MWAYKEEGAIGLFIHRIGKILLSLLFWRLNKHSSLSLTSFDRNCSLLIILIVLCWNSMHVQVSLSLGNPRWSNSDMVLTHLSSTSLGLLAVIFPTQPRLWLAFFAARTHCWSMFHLVSCLQSCFPTNWPRVYILVNRVCLFALTFSERYKVPLSLFFQLVEFLLKWQHNFKVCQTLLPFLYYMNNCPLSHHLGPY